MSTTSKANTAPSGSSLPSRISSDVAGVTCSCSNVPASRSLTIDTAVMSVVRNESTKPKVPATMNGVPSSVGLKSARGDDVDAAAPRRAPRRAIASRAPLRGDDRRAGTPSALPASDGLGAVVEDLDLGGGAAPGRAASRVEVGRDDERGADRRRRRARARSRRASATARGVEGAAGARARRRAGGSRRAASRRSTPSAEVRAPRSRATKPKSSSATSGTAIRIVTVNGSRKRRAHLAPHQRPQRAASSSRAACDARSTRRNTSVIGGCSIADRALGDRARALPSASSSRGVERRDGRSASARRRRARPRPSAAERGEHARARRRRRRRSSIAIAVGEAPAQLLGRRRRRSAGRRR